MKCFNCRTEVYEDDSRTIANVVVVCRPCYLELQGIIRLGYFDEQGLEDELVFEDGVQNHLSVMA